MPSWKKVVTSGSNAAIPSVSPSGDFTIDAGGDIVLDADGADIVLKDGGTHFGSIKRVTSDLVIKSETSNKHMLFKGNDGGATITALDLDMENAGNASFNNDVDVSGALTLGTALAVAEGGTGATTLTSTAILKGNGTSAIEASGITINSDNDLIIPAASQLYLAGNTYLQEAASDVLDFYVGGVKMYTIDETNNLITMRGTGGSDGAVGSPTLRLSNTVASGDWDTGDVVGALEFYAEDTSGNAPYVTSFIKSVNPQNNGTLPGGYLSFGTSPYNQSGGATEEFRMEEDGDFHAVGDIVAYSSTPSDERLKDNVVTISNSLDLVSQLRGVRFDWNIGSKKGQQDIGVIAQEVEEIIPEIVSEKKLPLLTGNDETIYKVVDYEKLTAVLIESIKELKQEIDDIKQKCDCLNK